MIDYSQLRSQDAASAVICQLTGFYDHAMFFLTIVITFVLSAVIRLLKNQTKCRDIYEAQEIELIWTFLPGVILIFLAIPSLRLLYLIDEIDNPLLTIKTVAHQWYWSYEYSDYPDIEFDSYIVRTQDLAIDEYRLLEVDNRIVLPIESPIRIIVTSADVIHSWTIPSLGVKIDAIPGRLNQISFNVNAARILYGQCSEICGANHSFIPICIEVINHSSFSNWVNKIM